MVIWLALWVMCFAFTLVLCFAITYSVWLTSAHVASDLAIYSGSYVRGSGHETSCNLTMRITWSQNKASSLIPRLPPTSSSIWSLAVCEANNVFIHRLNFTQVQPQSQPLLVSCPDPTREWSRHKTEPLLPPVFANTQIATWSGGEKARPAKQVIKTGDEESSGLPGTKPNNTHIFLGLQQLEGCVSISFSSSVSSFQFPVSISFPFPAFPYASHRVHWGLYAILRKTSFTLIRPSQYNLWFCTQF